MVFTGEEAVKEADGGDGHLTIGVCQVMETYEEGRLYVQAVPRTRG